MDKKCEFCMALRPIVYCKADAAHLCLSCDAKVHSANALSFRHPRTLVCESCRHQPAIVRCYDHQMFMCQSCDTSHHVSFQHQKRVVSCFVGCPSAKELAALWGFELDELEGNNCTGKDQSVAFSVSGVSCSRSQVSSVSVLYAEAEGGSTGRITKVVKDNHRQQNSYLILQQIVELERLQLSEGIDGSCSLHVKDRTVGLPFRHETPLKLQKTQGHHIENSVGILEFEQINSSLQDKNEDLLSSSPFSQLDSGNPLHGDSFWQCKSPAHNNEIWLQNMQDLGVCNEVLCFDDVKIPDVDLTFCNFEELFRTEHEPIRAAPVDDDENMPSSFADKLDRGCVSIMDMEQSRITGESSCSEYKDDELSPTFPKQLLHYDHSYNTKLESKENVIMRYKEKKIIRHEKQGQYTSPKSKCGGKKRGNGDVLKVEDDCTSVTRSFRRFIN